MNLLAFLFRTSRTRILISMVSGIVAGFGSTALVAIANGRISESGATLEALAIAFITLCVVVLISKIVSQVVLIRLGQEAVFDLRLRLCRQILAAPLRRLEEMGAHRMMATLSSDVQMITNVLLIMHMVGINGAIVLGCFAYMTWLSWKAFLGVIAFIVLGLLSYQLLVLGSVKKLTLARKEQDSLFKHLRALTEGSKELKIHRDRRNAFMKDLLEPTAQTYKQLNVEGMTRFAVASSWGQLLFFLLIGCLLFVLPSWTAIQAETLSGFLLAVIYMMAPLEFFVSTIPAIAHGNISFKKVEELGLSLSESKAEIAAKTDSRSDWRSLELESVTHAYYREREGESFTLGPIDLSLRPGEVVFLVGGNGSGKTTLAKVLIGLYPPEQGRVRFDGEEVDEANREAYRQNFSVVFSDFFLFDELLGLNRNGDGQPAAQEYLSRLHLERQVSIEGNRLSTTDLSQGQRKRLALLTAFLEDRPIYVFDEWAADQDPSFKEVFYRQILPELKSRGKAVLVISHDDHYYDQADRIVKLDYGRIEEQSHL